ncbi:hypothetical protein V1460_28030 [Streptomyces sp. SCSIO 30461]|uniref:hypothetical protein n=1 Tax=Streptomyces sp. SCSIO 30461 TaxID=3118085 RepID=UPI0030D21A27
MSAEFWASIGVYAATAGAGVWAARSARRTPKQERRDDFIAITDQQGKAIERLEKRVQLREAEAEAEAQRIADQDEAIGWLLGRVRGLVLYIRKAGLEPPAAEPLSERAARYIHHIDT